MWFIQNWDYYFVHTFDLSVANNVICPITLKYSLEYTFIL
jgi:hypothetical protein